MSDEHEDWPFVEMRGRYMREVLRYEVLATLALPRSMMEIGRVIESLGDIWPDAVLIDAAKIGMSPRKVAVVARRVDLLDEETQQMTMDKAIEGSDRTSVVVSGSLAFDNVEHTKVGAEVVRQLQDAAVAHGLTNGQFAEMMDALAAEACDVAGGAVELQDDFDINEQAERPL